MYLLTIYKKRKVERVIEFLEPPTTSEIETHLNNKKDLTFDISRKPIDDEDIEEYLYDVEQVLREETDSSDTNLAE